MVQVRHSDIESLGIGARTHSFAPASCYSNVANHFIYLVVFLLKFLFKIVRQIHRGPPLRVFILD